MFCCFLCCCRQKVTKCSIWLLSILLFLASAFTIYISVMLFKNKDMFWGLLPIENPTTETNHGTQYFKSIFHVAFFIVGLIGIILALLGCCTAKTRDRCSVCCFSIVGIILFGLFTGIAVAVIVLSNQSFSKMQNYCEGKFEVENLNFIEPYEMVLLEMAYPKIAEIDD